MMSIVKCHHFRREGNWEEVVAADHLAGPTVRHRRADRTNLIRQGHRATNTHIPHTRRHQFTTIRTWITTITELITHWLGTIMLIITIQLATIHKHICWHTMTDMVITFTTVAMVIISTPFMLQIINLLEFLCFSCFAAYIFLFVVLCYRKYVNQAMRRLCTVKKLR